MSEQIKPDFRQWAVVELMGHQRIAGWVTEETIGGCSFIRVDVPKADAPADSPLTPENTMFTRHLGSPAIYALNPTTQAEVMRIVKVLHPPPPTPRVSEQRALSAGYDDDYNNSNFDDE